MHSGDLGYMDEDGFVLAFTGQASLRMAVFADIGASLIVVFNGLRLLRFEFRTTKDAMPCADSHG